MAKPGLRGYLNHSANVKYCCHNAHCTRGLSGLGDLAAGHLDGGQWMFDR